MSAEPAVTERPTPARPDTDRRVCDGVICFGGEDWWYHNRGHYDMQMMREISAHVPVLYVNSIGMRVPRLGEGRTFFKRVLRKLKSFSQGFTRVREHFAVASPFSVPGGLGVRATRLVMPRQVRAYAKRMGITRPLVWINCPPGAEALKALRSEALVYQRTDRYEEFTGVDREQIAGYDRRLKRDADLTLFCASLLYEQEADRCRDAMMVDHGVDYDRFADAGAGFEAHREPDDVRGIPRPRVGFVGGLDAHTFWPEMFREVVRAMPDVQFVLVGGSTFPEGWLDEPNAHLLGQRPYEQVAAYMAACDVLVMPWNRGEWIKACNPVKLKEYLAVGRPVVTTGFYELKNYGGLVRVAEDADAFQKAIREAIEGEHDPKPGRDRVRDQTWTAKADAVLAALRERGVDLPPQRRHPEGGAG